MPVPRRGESREDFVKRCMSYQDLQSTPQRARLGKCEGIFDEWEKRRSKTGRKSCTGCGCCKCCDGADPLDLLSRRPEGRGPEGFSYRLGKDVLGLDANVKEDPEFDDANMAVRYIFASSWDRDRQGDICEIGPTEWGQGIVTDAHRQNPVAYLDHGKDAIWTQSIGLDENPDTRDYTVELLPERGIALAKTYLSKSCPIADAVYAWYRDRLLRGGSIGYRKRKVRRLPPDPEMGHKGGLHLVEVELLETTLTSMPANQDCLYKVLDSPLMARLPVETKSFFQRQAEPRPAWSPGWGAGKAAGPAHKPPGPGGGQFTSGPGGSGGGGGSKPRGGAASTSGSQARKKAKRSEGKPSTRESSPETRKGALKLAHAGMALARAGYGLGKGAAKKVSALLGHPAAAPLVNSYNAIHAGLMVVNRGAKALAQRVAEEKGLPPERLESLTRTLGVIDLTFQGAAFGGFLVAEATHQHHLAVVAKLASYLPIGSMAYIVGGGGKTPIKTAKLAFSMLQEHFPDAIKGSAAFAWGAIRHPLTIQEHGHGAGHKTYEDDLATWAALVAEHLAAASDPDLWTALFSVAFDDVRDVAEAVRMADECLADYEPDEDEDDDQGTKSIGPAMSSVDQSVGGALRNGPVFLSRRRRLRRKGASMVTPATPPATPPTGRKSNDGDPANPDQGERIPHGAGVLADLHSCLELMRDIIAQEESALDNENVKKAIGEIKSDRDALAEKVRGHFTKNYPDLEELKEEEPDDDGGKNIRPGRKSITPKTPSPAGGGIVAQVVTVDGKRLTKSATETVREASDFLDDHVERENLTPSGKAACMYHSKSLRELTKDDDDDGDMDEETGKALGTLLTKTLKRLDANEASIKKALGT